jgi:hypothetical protein
MLRYGRRAQGEVLGDRTRGALSASQKLQDAAASWVGQGGKAIHDLIFAYMLN